ncbi:Hypothetical predicted protein [Podarcis lilfordi]|uniref:Uncharacterized protein n=1 Tax=Podarcis lilfordi TaxID=74358 RepID=A0AA35PLY1_9SAUR|nr:Hypothetical predicted protein [Podarcis lilfordi]
MVRKWLWRECAGRSKSLQSTFGNGKQSLPSPKAAGASISSNGRDFRSDFRRSHCFADKVLLQSLQAACKATSRDHLDTL